MPITTALRFYIADKHCAEQAGIGTAYMRKSNDGSLVCFQDTNASGLQLTMLAICCSMSSKLPVAVDEVTLRELLETDANWIGTEEPSAPPV